MTLKHVELKSSDQVNLGNFGFLCDVLYEQAFPANLGLQQTAP
jgi:hypothetical protein